MLPALRSRLTLLAVVIMMLPSLGCGPEPDPTGTLIGTVTTKGEILNDCLVSIASNDSLFRRGGKVDEAGAFKLTGIPFGEYQVRVVQTPTNLPTNTFDERIPQKYRDLKTSGLSASITSVEPVTIKIEME